MNAIKVTTKTVATRVEVHLCIQDKERHHLPNPCTVPHVLPRHAPLPRQGEVVYLGSDSAWWVTSVIHHWRTPQELRVELWLEHMSPQYGARPREVIRVH